MRYFLVSFCLSDKFSAGQICLVSEDFFSHEYLVEEIKKGYSAVQNVTITNIFEFRNKEDHDAFRGLPKMSNDESKLAEYMLRIKTMGSNQLKLSEEVMSRFSLKKAQEFLDLNLPPSVALKELLFNE